MYQPPPIPAVLSLVRQVAEALAVAHEAGLVHRDVKPENVMVRDDGYVKVLAFGLTWLLREVPLKTTAQAPDIGDGFHPSHDDDRLREIERALSLLAREDQRWEMYERGAEEAQLAYDTAEAHLEGRQRLAVRPHS